MYISDLIDYSNILKSYRPGKYINKYTVKQAAIALTVDQQYEKFAETKIEKLVSNYYYRIFRSNEDNKIQVNHKARPRTVMLAGGPASGKSTHARLIRLKLEHDGINWQDVVKVNTDDYKQLLYASTPKPHDLFHTQLVQPEAEIISHYKLL